MRRAWVRYGGWAAGRGLHRGRDGDFSTFLISVSRHFYFCGARDGYAGGAIELPLAFHQKNPFLVFFNGGLYRTGETHRHGSVVQLFEFVFYIGSGSVCLHFVLPGVSYCDGVFREELHAVDHLYAEIILRQYSCFFCANSFVVRLCHDVALFVDLGEDLHADDFLLGRLDFFLDGSVRFGVAYCR